LFIPALQTLLNRIETSFGSGVEKRWTTKSGDWNWVKQFRPLGKAEMTPIPSPYVQPTDQKLAMRKMLRSPTQWVMSALTPTPDVSQHQLRIFSFALGG
jgi:hypothetical protein